MTNTILGFFFLVIVKHTPKPYSIIKAPVSQGFG